ncbi:MAG: ATP-binding protein [Nostoc sp.]|uniref:ATP-binding protein n=1 Tax=Nostoc sp. TaxID=1180 RepID=UPI002FF9B7F3
MGNLFGSHPLSCENKGSPRLTGKAGLGLSIVKHLTEGMEGKIAILSKPGYGSTFILTLPALGAKI